MNVLLGLPLLSITLPSTSRFSAERIAQCPDKFPHAAHRNSFHEKAGDSQGGFVFYLKGVFAFKPSRL
jgi:hypothetical protein